MAGTSRVAKRGSAGRGRARHRSAEHGTEIPTATDTIRPAAGSSEDIRGLAREAAVAAIARLRTLSNSDDERVALAATQELLNRAFGKVAAGGDEQGSAAQPPLVIKIVRFGGDDGIAAGAAAKPGEAA